MEGLVLVCVPSLSSLLFFGGSREISFFVSIIICGVLISRGFMLILIFLFMKIVEVKLVNGFLLLALYGFMP